MLIYLVGQDKKSEEEEVGATALSRPSGAPCDGATPEEEKNPLGLELDPYWVDDVQEQRICTFTR